MVTLNVLAKLPGLKVSARTSAFFYKGKQVAIKQVAQELAWPTSSRAACANPATACASPPSSSIAELRAVHEQGYGFGYLLRLQLEWEPLRGDAQFQQLMKEAEARADAQPRPQK